MICATIPAATRAPFAVAAGARTLVGSRTEPRRKLERQMHWEDHELYPAGLTEVLGHESAKRLIVIGDVNQRIGSRSRAPPKLRLAI